MPPIETRAPVSLSIGGSVSVARLPDDLVGALVLRRRRRVGDHRRGVAALVELRRQDLRDPVLLAQRVADLLERRLVARLRQLDGEQQRGVEAGPEPLLEQVVGDPRGVVLLVGAGIARRQPHVERGQRQRDQHGEREHGHRQRPSRHEGAPARGEAGLTIGQVGVAAVAVPRRLDAAADLAEQRRHQRQRGGHREQHRQRGADGGTVEERDPEQHHAEHRDHDDDAREQDGAAGRVDRDQRGLAHVTPGAALEPEAVEDQQRVVDANADPDHRRQLRCPVDDVEHAGSHHGHQPEAHDHREQRR